MKQAVKGYICGLLTACMGIGVVAFAGGQWKSIDVLSNDIKVIADGKEITADNFLYQDTTYLPLRAVVEAIGREVTYDEKNNTAYIGKVPLSQISTTPGGAGSAVLPQGGGNAGIPLNTPRPEKTSEPVVNKTKTYTTAFRINNKLYKPYSDFPFYVDSNNELYVRGAEVPLVLVMANGLNLNDYIFEPASNPYFGGKFVSKVDYFEVIEEYISPTIIKYTAKYKDRNGNVIKQINDYDAEAMVNLNELFRLYDRELKFEVDDENKLLILELAE